MIKSIKIYNNQGELLEQTELGADGSNVEISVSGLSANNLQSALVEIVKAIDSINTRSNLTTGVEVNNVGALSIPFGNIPAGTDINGLTLTELLKLGFGSAS